MPDSIAANTRTGLHWLANGRLQVEPLITHRLPPTSIQAAYDGLRDRREDYLGVILDWR